MDSANPTVFLLAAVWYSFIESSISWLQALTSDDLERFPNFNITLVEASSSKYFALSFSGMDYTVPNADGLTCSGISSHSDRFDNFHATSCLSSYLLIAK